MLRIMLLVLVCIASSSIGAAAAQTRSGSAAPWLTPSLANTFFPQLIYTGPLEGTPPAVSVYGPGSSRLGYLFITEDVVDTVGFTGEPFTLAVALDNDGVMLGVQLLAHSEPIIDYRMLNGQLARFLQQYGGLDYHRGWRIGAGTGKDNIDGVTSATISVSAFHRAIVQSARIVAQTRGLYAGGASVAMPDTLHFTALNWDDLIARGAIAHRRIMSTRSMADRVTRTEPHGGRPATDAVDSSADIAIDLYAAVLTPASIGRNLLGDMRYGNFVATYSPQDFIIMVMADGAYSFVGTEVFDSGIFERIRIAQNGHDYALRRELSRYHYLPFVSAHGAPEFSEIALFRLPADSGIDVLADWDLVLRVVEENSAADVADEFRLHYMLPAQFILPPAAADVLQDSHLSGWQAVWQAQTGNLAILTVALVILTAILILIGPLSRRPRLYQVLRNGFLLFILVWLGWIANAQLSVIHPLTWVRILSGDVDAQVLLNEPLLCVLLGFVIVGFFIWGRGVFCGWLCPFGALQELLAKLAQRLGVAQISLSHRLQRRLWPLKYVVLAGLMVAALQSATALGIAAEVEPFKTAITLQFARPWPFVLYVVLLLVAGLFVERAFCRFLCPLGAIMALGGKLRLISALKRRSECGSPCQLCARRCPIQAIAPDGRIDMDECFYCLDCQIIYYDVSACPPLVLQQRRTQAG